jgi:hypothetical protein
MSEYEDRDYEVGYGKPPKSTRWKPGQSGNPKGRPKKIKDFDKLIDRELSLNVRITEDGESKVVSKRELIIKRLVTEALKGDKSALKLMVNLMKANLSVEGFEPDPAEHAALLAMLARAQNEDDGEALDGGEELSDG